MLDRKCRICGCTDISACIGRDGQPCCWVDDDLCSVCADLWDTAAVCDVLDERARQVKVEGWTVEHDDEHEDGEMARAAAAYALHSHYVLLKARDPFNPVRELGVAVWPWDRKWWKPSRDRRRDLVKAAALLIAEIERIDRTRLIGTCEGCGKPVMEGDLHHLCAGGEPVFCEACAPMKSEVLAQLEETLAAEVYEQGETSFATREDMAAHAANMAADIASNGDSKDVWR